MAKQVNIPVNFETKQAQQNLDDLNTSWSSFIDNVEKSDKDVKSAGKSTEKAGESAKKSSKGWFTLGNAIRVTGVGALIQGLLQLQEVIRGNDKVMDIFNTAFESLKIILSDVIGFVVDGIVSITDFRNIFSNLGDTVMDFPKMIKDYVIDTVQQMLEGFGMVGRAIGKLFKGDFKEAAELAKEGAKTLWNTTPLAKVTKAVGEVAKSTYKYVKSVVESGKAIVDTNNKIVELNTSLAAQKVELENLISLETKKRDNENLSFEERKQANQELMTLTEELFEIERQQAQAKIEALEAEQRLYPNKRELDAQIAEAQAALDGVENRETETILAQAQAYQDLTNAQTQSINEIANLNQLSKEKELEDLRIHGQQLMEQARKNGQGQTEVLDFIERKKGDIRKKYRDINLQAAGAVFGALAGMNKQGSKNWKKLATGQALINTFLGVTKALSDKEMPFFARIAGAATQLIMGMTNVTKIKNTDMESGGSPDTSATTSTPTPTGIGAMNLGDMIPNQLTEELTDTTTQPVQAYVVETDISNSQALQEELNLQTTL
tara:strand:+ start:8006 stop:9655 length:1650 start_codon:yes stop_codon:yes gene_type:complete